MLWELSAAMVRARPSQLPPRGVGEDEVEGAALGGHVQGVRAPQVHKTGPVALALLVAAVTSGEVASTNKQITSGSDDRLPDIDCLISTA